VDYFRRLAQEYNLPLSQGAQLAHPNRVGWDFITVDAAKKVATSRDAELIDYAINTCALTDVAGILVTGNNKSTPRKSLVEFGWMVGLPSITKTESFLHTKYVPDSGTEPKDADGANQGQNLFHRPASSGIYAAVCHIDLARLGYNDVAQRYPAGLTEEARKARCKLLLESVLYTFLQIDGAHRNTQAPHVVGFEGIVTTSTTTTPAPAFSSLHHEYQLQIERIAEGLNKLHSARHDDEYVESRPDAIKVRPFTDMAAFTAIMGDLIATTTPYRLPSFNVRER
jgi:CRISPR-associated protein Cst2